MVSGVNPRLLFVAGKHPILKHHLLNPICLELPLYLCWKQTSIYGDTKAHVSGLHVCSFLKTTVLGMWINQISNQFVVIFQNFLDVKLFPFHIKIFKQLINLCQWTCCSDCWESRKKRKRTLNIEEQWIFWSVSQLWFLLVMGSFQHRLKLKLHVFGTSGTIL